MAQFCKKHGHPTPTAAYRDKSGTCLACKRLYDEQYRLKKKAALDVCRGLEARGIRFENAGQPVTADDVAAQLLRTLADRM